MKIVNLFKYFSAIILIALSFSCSDDNKKDPEATYDINVTPKLGVLDSNMSQLKKDVLNKFINKQPIKQSDITRLLIEEQVNYYNKDNASSPVQVDTIANWIEDVSYVNRETYSLEEIKVLYQLQKLQISTMKYNKKATSLPYLLNDKKLQCFSATMLHQLVARSHSNFKNMNSVVIYENGHILSGHMVKENNWKLVGIENTVKGKGIKKYNDLKDYEGTNIRVVDSDLFALVEIFKNDISNINEVAKQVLDLTAKKYNLDPKFNYNYDYISTQALYSSFDSNESPLAFGYRYVPEGDQDIEEKNEINTDSSSDNANLLSPLPFPYYTPVPYIPPVEKEDDDDKNKDDDTTLIPNNTPYIPYIPYDENY